MSRGSNYARGVVWWMPTAFLVRTGPQSNWVFCRRNFLTVQQSSYRIFLSIFVIGDKLALHIALWFFLLAQNYCFTNIKSRNDSIVPIMSGSPSVKTEKNMSSRLLTMKVKFSSFSRLMRFSFLAYFLSITEEDIELTENSPHSSCSAPQLQRRPKNHKVLPPVMATCAQSDLDFPQKQKGQEHLNQTWRPSLQRLQ